jgi:hypothetical protein
MEETQLSKRANSRFLNDGEILRRKDYSANFDKVF